MYTRKQEGLYWPVLLVFTIIPDNLIILVFGFIILQITQLTIMWLLSIITHHSGLISYIPSADPPPQLEWRVHSSRVSHTFFSYIFCCNEVHLSIPFAIWKFLSWLKLQRSFPLKCFTTERLNKLWLYMCHKIYNCVGAYQLFSSNQRRDAQTRGSNDFAGQRHHNELLSASRVHPGSTFALSNLISNMTCLLCRQPHTHFLGMILLPPVQSLPSYSTPFMPQLLFATFQVPYSIL